MSVRSLQQTIHVGARALGLDADDRRALQLAATGKESLTEMDEADLKKVVDRMVKAGFKPGFKGAVKPGAKARRPAAPRADLRLVHRLWTRLGDAGLLERAGRDGLNAFIRSRFGAAWGAVPADVDMIRDAAQIEAVIRALKTMGKRAGVDLEKRP